MTNANQPTPGPDRSNTYFVQDRSSDSQELQRLQVQDKLATIAMGGALPEQEEPESLRRRIRVPENYEQLYQQALIEMQQPDFVAYWHLLTAWGKNTSREKPAAARQA